jgi:phage terminase small subunit
VREYLLDLNGTRAAVAAGYSSKTASVVASRMLRKVKVQALLKQRMEERQQRLDLSADRVLQEIAKIAFFDPRKLFNQDGSLKNINELDADTAAAIAGFEIASFAKMPGKSRLRSS